MDTAPPRDAQVMLEAARALFPVISARSTEIEQLRRLPADLVALLRAEGMFSMAMPRTRGGPQLSLTEQILVIEALSRADSSVGWCVKIGGDSGYFAGIMKPDVVDELLPRLDMIVAGFAPMGPGRLDRVEGGYLLSGRFPFGSGSTHADLFFASGAVFENGVPASGGTWGGVPVRLGFTTADKVEIEDNWFTTGLSGTGSNHWVAKEVFIPERHTLDPVADIRRRDTPSYAHPLNFTATLAAVPLGIMRRALDEASAFVRQKTVPFPPPPRPLSEMAQARGVIAQAAMIQGSARAYVLQTAVAFTRALTERGEAPPELRAQLGLCMAHACRAACEVTRQLFDLVGTGAIHRDAVMGRLMRDAMTANQHVTVSQGNIEQLGGVLLGHPHPSPFY